MCGKGAYSVPGGPHDLVLLDTSVDQLNRSDSNVDYMIFRSQVQIRRQTTIFFWRECVSQKRGDLGGFLPWCHRNKVIV